MVSFNSCLTNRRGIWIDQYVTNKTEDKTMMADDHVQKVNYFVFWCSIWPRYIHIQFDEGQQVPHSKKKCLFNGIQQSKIISSMYIQCLHCEKTCWQGIGYNRLRSILSPRNYCHTSLWRKMRPAGCWYQNWLHHHKVTGTPVVQFEIPRVAKFKSSIICWWRCLSLPSFEDVPFII